MRSVYVAFLLGHGVVVLSLFAVALAGTGLLTTVGVIVAMDTFGPISDNAQGVAEMSGEISPEGAEVLTGLDAVGNTTKAITKGIAIATAVLAATALFGSFATAVSEAGGGSGVLSLNVAKPNVLFGLIIGASVVFLFSGLAISAVARAAGRVVIEVRDQFRNNPGIMDGTVRPGLRPRRRHLHQGLAARARDAGSARGARTDRGPASGSATSRSAPTSPARSRPVC